MNGNRHSSRAGVWCLLLIVTIVLAPLMGSCAPKPRVYRVGILSGLERIAAITDGFKAGMAELGYVEGENIVYDVQRTDFDIAKYQSILQKFIADDVDLIFVFPTDASIEAKAATAETDIPVLFAWAVIEGNSLVESVRQPGGNITGVRYPGPEIAIRRFEIMHELAPQAKRILIPYQRGYPTVGPELEALRPVAEAAGVTLIEAPADNAAELDTILRAQAEGDDIGLDAILAVPETLSLTPDAFAVMARFAYEHKLPIGGALMEAEGYKSVFGVTTTPYVSGKQAAPLADKILRGTPAGTIPVVSAETFFQLNYTAAQELGLTVSEGLLGQADEVIR